jgi:hypothetical protein
MFFASESRGKSAKSGHIVERTTVFLNAQKYFFPLVDETFFLCISLKVLEMIPLCEKNNKLKIFLHYPKW